MNVLLIVGGSAASLLFVLFLLLWFVDGLKVAASVAVSTILFAVIMTGIVWFWMWAGGAL